MNKKIIISEEKSGYFSLLHNVKTLCNRTKSKMGSKNPFKTSYNKEVKKQTTFCGLEVY